MIEPADPRPPDVEHVAVEQVRVGDVLTMSGDSDPRSHIFRVADVDIRNELITGEQPRVILTSQPHAGSDPMVLNYPTGTLLRRIIPAPEK